LCHKLPVRPSDGGMCGAVVIAAWSYGLVRDTGAILLDMNPDLGMADRMKAELSLFSKGVWMVRSDWLLSRSSRAGRRRISLAGPALLVIRQEQRYRSISRSASSRWHSRWL
jgi:hypothetical protein